MYQKSNNSTNIIEIEKNETLNDEIWSLFRQITADVINTRNRYYENIYAMVIMKTEKGFLSEDSISTGLTKLDTDYSKFDGGKDDSYLDAAYYDGYHMAEEFNKMGFPVNYSLTNHAETLHDFIGPLGLVCIMPDTDNLYIVYQTIDGFGLLTGISYEFRVEFDNLGNAYLFDYSGNRDIPQWINELTDGISDYCFCD